MRPPFGRLLIANRGEISVRIIRACRELGISPVAVFSDADRGSLHRRLADEAYHLGPAPPAESYLNVERLVEVVVDSGADAVHPGYGFLSESAAFARAVEEAGAVWVGPPPAAMDLMASKVEAKRLAERAGVPVLPGYAGGGGDDLHAAEARGIGYPVLVKASAGGGGRGMRVARRPEELAEALRAARREAEASFGDGSVFLERWLPDPRHIEVLVFGDAKGNVVHLFERECSVQRRHQKVLEETPSPALGAGLRERICAAAVDLARTAGYTNAGTVEFLLQDDEFFFLEMNARLQVEHPVTESVCGLDLVHLQLRVAAGEELPARQEGVPTPRGSAIEVRVYAEAGGVPQGGRLLLFDPPGGPGVRNDAGYEGGDEVPLHYDPMLAKLIVHAPDRPSAVLRLRRALDEYAVSGLETNLPLLRRIAAHPAFADGETTVSFLSAHDLTQPPEREDLPELALVLAAVAETAAPMPATHPFARPFRHLGSARLALGADGEHAVEVERAGAGRLRVRTGSGDRTLRVLLADGERLRLEIDGREVSARYARDGDALLLAFDGETYRVHRPAPPDVDGGGDAAGASANPTAPMPGTVVSVLVEEGDRVSKGQPLLILEAMKTEQTVHAPHDGTITSLPHGEGAAVPGGTLLAEISAEPELDTDATEA